jgi:hypothetical protein
MMPRRGCAVDRRVAACEHDAMSCRAFARHAYYWYSSPRTGAGIR